MSESSIVEIKSYGVDKNLGNLVGIQPYMEVLDYHSQKTFYDKMDFYFSTAQKQGFFNTKTTVVLPEYTATWLVVADEHPLVTKVKSVELAMVILIFSNLKNILKYFFQSPTKDRIKFSIFRSKSDPMLKIYHDVFSSLAKKYEVNIVAGSLVCPKISWKVNDSKKTPFCDSLDLFNTTLVFMPSGEAFEKAVYKIFPTPQELPFTTPGKLDWLPTYQTSTGKLGVLNCADSWYEETYRFLSEKIDHLAIPSFVEKDDDMSLPWRGNNITPLPKEFDSKDFLKITYDDAWLKYACPSRYSMAKVKNVVNVFLRGKFWNMGSDGKSILIHNQQLERGKDGVGAAIQNLWLGT